jgi:methylthioribose-1-phosphate isomerase
MTPHGVGIENPAFDVTPAKYISAIITERGVLRAPLGESIRAAADQVGSDKNLTEALV